MAEATSDTKLIHAYEDIRQQEYHLITSLLEVLPRIDNVGEEHISQVRDALFHADHPFLMVLVGPFSSGKSSIINALLGDPNLLRIGPTPTTDRISILRWGEESQHMGTAGGTNTVFHPSPLLRRISLVDTPGLESIFKEHEETTRKFLHRADVVLLVMLATQAMTQSNLESLQMFKQYGKKVIIVISQADLISDEDRATVQTYVTQQSKDLLGFEPTIWFVSAKWGNEALASEPLNQELWDKSGLQEVKNYIEQQLGDSERLRQKLQTPLQIVQSVHQGALLAVRQNQATFDRYRSITDNVDKQLVAQRREQEKAVRDINNEVEARFRSTGERSKEAIIDIFQFSRALGSLGRGIFELIGLARLMKRDDSHSYMRESFQHYKVFEPINEIPTVVDKLAPRLEGQDMQDIDDLVKYGKKEISNLPQDMRDKVIGTIQAPSKYDRSFLQNMRSELEQIETEAKVIETNKLEQIRRNTLAYLATWELGVFILIAVLFMTWGDLSSNSDLPLALGALVLLLGGALLGFAMLPFRGRMIHSEYVHRLLKLQERYTEVLTKAADKQIDYGMQVRREAIAPLTRLVNAQASIHDEQLNSLQSAEQAITKLEAQLNTFGKRKILGMTL